MLDTIMMMFKLIWRNWHWLQRYNTCTYAQDTIQERLTILISFCSKFTGVQVCQKLSKQGIHWQSKWKNKKLQFFSDSLCSNFCSLLSLLPTPILIQTIYVTRTYCVWSSLKTSLILLDALSTFSPSTTLSLSRDTVWRWRSLHDRSNTAVGRRASCVGRREDDEDDIDVDDGSGWVTASAGDGWVTFAV